MEQLATESVTRGLAAHQQNRLADAVTLYRQALTAAPDHFDALHMLGVALAQQSDYPEAIALLRRAAQVKPKAAMVHCNLGNAQRDAGHFDEAIASFDHALELKPAHVNALCGRARALQLLDRPAEAIASCDAALQIQPDRFDAYYLRGSALARLGRLREAIADYDKALQLKPDLWEALFHRGTALLDLKRPKQALSSFDEALSLRPDDAKTLNNRGIALRSIGKLPEALASLDRAITGESDDADAHANRGAVLFDMHRLPEALASYDRALQIAPSHPYALSGYGTVTQELGRLQEALDYLDRALAIAPNHPEIHNNRGSILLQLGRRTEALGCFEQAMRFQPDYTTAHVNAGMCRLLLGDLREGWKEFEWRRRWLVSRGVRPGVRAPDWDGSQSLRGKSILLWSEQGAGDTIQFCRFVPVLAERGAKVLLRAEHALRGLLVGLQGLERVLIIGDPLPFVDYQAPLLSVPLALGIDHGSIPAQSSYLRADPQRVAAWASKLGLRRLPRVGVVWSGSQGHRNDRHRSIPLRQFAPLLQGGFEFVCLHKEVRDADRPLLVERPDIRTFCSELTDFRETAALIQHMDLVIAVDTSVAHLAAALGRPVWLLLPFAPDWRWMLDREDSPWYPTAHLFRQPQPDDWQSVLDRVSHALQSTTFPIASPNSA